MTLIECTISIAVVAAMLVASMHALGVFARARRSQFERCMGGAFARALMGEILQCDYLEPGEQVTFGRESGEAADDRTAWNDVDDYHGMSETTLRTKAGAALANGAGWSRTVTVEYVPPDDPTQTSGSDTGLVRITVSAVSPTGVTTTLQALRGDQSIYDQAPREETTFVTWVTAQMQIGPDVSKRVTTGTHVLNRAIVSE